MASLPGYHVDTVLHHLKQEVLEAAASGHLAGRLPAAAAQPQLQVALREEELQRVGGVCAEGAGVGGGQVQRCEASIGLGVQLRPLPQEEARHGNAAPAAGAVEGRPPVHGEGVDLCTGCEESRNGVHVAAVGGAVQRGVAVFITAVQQGRVVREQPAEGGDLRETEPHQQQNTVLVWPTAQPVHSLEGHKVKVKVFIRSSTGWTGFTASQVFKNPATLTASPSGL